YPPAPVIVIDRRREKHRMSWRLDDKRLVGLLRAVFKMKRCVSHSPLLYRGGGGLSGWLRLGVRRGCVRSSNRLWDDLAGRESGDAECEWSGGGVCWAAVLVQIGRRAVNVCEGSTARVRHATNKPIPIPRH